MSLAWSSMPGVVVTVATSMYFRPKAFPQIPSLRGSSGVIHFGKFANGIYVFGQLGKGVPKMIIGRAQDMAGVAVFSRANGLVQIFHQLVVKAVMPVCLPYFVKAVRDESSVVRRYVTGVTFLTVIGRPFLGFMALAAFPSIRIVYGDQWAASVPLAKILCVAGAMDLVHFLAREALLSHGHVKLSARLQVLVTAITLAPMLAGLPFVSASESNYGRFMILGGVTTALMWPLALRATRHALWSELAALAGAVAGRIRSRRGPVAPPA